MAVGLRWALLPLLGRDLPLATLYGAVALAAWFGGVGPAVVTVVLGLGVCEYLFMETKGSFVFNQPRNLIGFAAYLFSCAIIIALSEKMRRAEGRAEEALKRNETDLDAMTRLREVGVQCADPRSDFDQCLGAILELAISLTGADKGNIQLVDTQPKVL